MRILQARFHFYPGDPGPLVVGHIVWSLSARGARPVIHPLFRARPTQSPVQIMSDLRRLVDNAGPNPYHALLALRSSAWSFVQVSEAAWQAAAARLPDAVQRRETPPPEVIVVS